MDYFTDWLAIISLDHGTTATQVISAIRQSFCWTAIPDIVWSDGGPQFTSKLFSDFASCWGFLHKVSSPHYPQSNGKVKATVKAMKKILYTSWTGRALDHDKLCCALLQYGNTPIRKDGLSSAHKLFGHPAGPRNFASPPSFIPTRVATPALSPQLSNKMTLQSSAAFYNLHAHTLHDILTLDHMLPQTKL